MNVSSACHVLSAAMMIAVLLLFSGCGGGGSSDSSEETPLSERKWTYMVYIAADNSLSAYADEDINEMEAVGSGDDVNIVIQVEFADLEPYSSETLRSRVMADNDTNTMNCAFTSIGHKDMTDPDTLAEFIAWTAENYPAQHYALTVWSHGSGWKTVSSSAVYKGVITDDTDNPNELMTMAQLADAIYSSEVDVELVNFDTCLMGMYEVAYELSGLADYLVFSEASYPGDGDPYDDILQALTDEPDMGAEDLAEAIPPLCNAYYEDYYDRTEGYMTKSAIDMAYMDSLHEGLCSLAEVMIDNLDSQASVIQSARSASVSYDYPENHDLGDFLDNLYSSTGSSDMATATAQVQTTLDSLVISNEAFSTILNDDVVDSQGIAIYLPAGNQTDEAELGDYAGLACNDSGSTTWGDFIDALVSYESSTFP